MLKHSNVDSLLRAMADPTRRAIIERLSQSPAAVGELAKPFDMSLAAIVQHLQLLEAAGIVASEKVGRVRICRLEPGGMDPLALWIEARRHPSERRLDRLAHFLKETDHDPTIDTLPAVHSTFRIERYYAASPARVFNAFADTASKRRWMVEGEGFRVFEHKMDFRVDGRETSRFAFGDGPEILNEAVYQDIVPDERIVCCYRMAMAGAPMSASLNTIELAPQGSGCLLVLTEQGTYLDGRDDGTGREQGTRSLLEALAKEVEG